MTLALFLLLAPAAQAAGLPAFHYTSLKELRALPPSAELPAPPDPGAGRPLPAADVITDARFILQAGRSDLYGWADDAGRAAEPAAYWTAALKAAGVAVGPMTFKDGMFVLPYKTGDGRLVRRFLADERQFAPKDEGALRANMAATMEALRKAGLTPLAARVLDVDFMLPTYEVLYLTSPASKPELEKQLRVLKTEGDIDASVYAKAGLTVVQTPQPWLTVYIGPEAGYVSMAAATKERAAEKLAERGKFLAEQGLRVIETRVTPVDEADFKFVVELYWVTAPEGAMLSEGAEAMATVCLLRRVEKDECVYRCRDGREVREPARAPEPGDPGPVRACPQVIVPF